MKCGLSHRRLCVSDIEASQSFYMKVFDFEQHGLSCRENDLDDDVRASRLRNAQGVELQLFTFRDPPPTGPRTRRPMTERGMTHLNFYVRDLEETLADVRRHGGEVVEQTRIDTDDGTSMVYCTDPDGIRVEVWTTTPYGVGSMAHAIPGIDRRFSHSGICVSDLERSMRVYRALGFELAEPYDYRNPPGQLDRMMEQDGTAFFAQMMWNGDDVIELLHFDQPIATGDGGPGEPNRLGLAGLAFIVEPMDAAAHALAAAGARALDERWSAGDAVGARHVDPDGVRLDLLPLRDTPARWRSVGAS